MWKKVVFQIQYPMKKIISSVFISSLLLVSCGPNKQDEKVKPLAIQPKVLVGIGKVLPDGGIVNLSVSHGNQVIKVFKKLGDQVKEGEALFEMQAINERLQVEQKQAVLLSAQENVKAVNYDIQAAEIKLASLKKEFETSRKLRASFAETPQKVFLDSVAYMEQLANVERQKQSLKAQQTSLNEQRIAVKSSQVSVGDQLFRALQSGVLIRFDVAVGSELGANTIFGELAPLKDLVIEGEIDELYANQIKVGLPVDIVLVGQSDVLAKGVISFVGSSLQNKSILYETVGEGSDRRVRRFTVKIESGAQHLLINQKVECKIQL